MVLNWKIKLTKTKSQAFGNNSGNYLDDLDKFATALGITKDQCFEQITGIKVKKLDVWSGDTIDAIQFTYSVETKDKTIEVEGHKHGGNGGTLQTWSFNGDWWLTRINGKTADIPPNYYNVVRWLQFKSFSINGTYGTYDNWQGEKGNNAGNGFNMNAPACFFSWGGNFLYAFGFYQGEWYDADLSKWENIFWTKEPNIIKDWYNRVNGAWNKQDNYGQPFSEKWFDKVSEKLNDLKKYTDNLGSKSPEQLKADIDNLNKRPNTTQEEYQKLLNNQEKHTAEDLEKHKPEDLKPADYDEVKTNLTDLKSSYVTLGLNQFGEKIDKDSLEKIKNKLDEIKSKDDTITTLNEQLTARNDTIEAHEGTISELTDENENLTTAKNDLKDKLEKEVARTKELESRLTTLSEQFLKPEREKVKHELTNFFQEMDINSEDIGKWYKSDQEWTKLHGEEFDHEDIVDQKLNFENKEAMKQAFKVMACICASENLKTTSERYGGVPASWSSRLQQMLKAINQSWEAVGNYQPIQEENNPFYLKIIAEKWTEYQQYIADLAQQLQQAQVEIRGE